MKTIKKYLPFFGLSFFLLLVALFIFLGYQKQEESSEKLYELVDLSYFTGQKEAINDNFFVEKTDTGYVGRNLGFSKNIKWYTPKYERKYERLLYSLVEVTIYDSQIDYLEGRIYVEKVNDSTYRWIKSPWKDRETLYNPAQ